MSLATATTPRTRSAASSAAHFLVNESTHPVSVTTPSFTATPISFGSTRASHFSSASTSRWISSSVLVVVAVAMGSASGLLVADVPVPVGPFTTEAQLWLASQTIPRYHNLSCAEAFSRA